MKTALASTLSKAGFTVHLEEPDLVIEGNGLSQKIGIACKYPSSEKGIHDHISKGLSQLKKHGLPGLIALGIDQIVVEKADLKKFGIRNSLISTSAEKTQLTYCNDTQMRKC